MNAIRIQRTGGPEVLSYTRVERPTPQKDEILVKNTAIGVNFIDTYHRSGLYPLQLPQYDNDSSIHSNCSILGREGAGEVVAVGSDVHDFAEGDRVAYVLSPGAYAEYTTVSVKHVARVPASVSLEHAAAVLLQGLTAHYLTRSTVWLLHVI